MLLTCLAVQGDNAKDVDCAALGSTRSAVERCLSVFDALSWGSNRAGEEAGEGSKSSDGECGSHICGWLLINYGSLLLDVQCWLAEGLLC